MREFLDDGPVEFRPARQDAQIRADVGDRAVVLSAGGRLRAAVGNPIRI
ncbi:MAG TPA: hypothetical protein VLC47_06935 [Burkholderiales bacterium]|nr:hypothetical protein [Burkholderiales bacterium]